jgi:hypothetical protein
MKDGAVMYVTKLNAEGFPEEPLEGLFGSTPIHMD